MKPKFSLGQLVATPGALRALEESGELQHPPLVGGKPFCARATDLED